MRIFIARIVGFAVFFLIIGELFFRFVLPAADLPVSHNELKYPILRYDPNIRQAGIFTSGRYAQTRGTWRINDAGWNSHREYIPAKDRSKPALAYFGSSLVEGFYSKLEENIAYVLEQQTGDRYDVYNFSMSESLPSEHLEVAKYARDLFAPEHLVFFVAPGHLEASVQPAMGRQRWALNKGVVTKRPFLKRDYQLRQIARKSALARYLVLNARIRPNFRNESPNDLSNQSEKKAAGMTEPEKRILADHLVKQAISSHPDSKIIFVTGQPHFFSSDPKNKPDSPPEIDIEGKLISEACKTYGARHIEITQVFYKDWLEHQKAHDFSHNRHWNAHAFKVIANELAQYLGEPNP